MKRFPDSARSSRRRRGPRPGARAFTLVELCVVMLVIVVLMSLLLPGLTNARETAKNVQCAATLRQIGLAYPIYAQNNKGFIIPALTSAPSPSNYWLPLAAAELGLDGEYITKPYNMFKCPSNTVVPTLSAGANFSYFVGPGLCGDLTQATPILPMKFDHVLGTTRNQRIVVAESGSGGYFGSSYNGTGNRGTLNFHTGGANYLMLDSSVLRFVDPGFNSTPVGSRSALFDYSTVTNAYWFNNTTDRNL